MSKLIVWILFWLILIAVTIGVVLDLSPSKPAPKSTLEITIDGPGPGPDMQDYAIWKGPRPSPVTMYYDPTGETWAVPDSVITAALYEWNTLTPNFQYIYGGRLPSGSTLGQENTCTSSPPNGWNTISWANLTGGTVARSCIWSTSPECDIEFDNVEQPVLLQPEAFRTILLHEAGHCLGLAHSEITTAVMYYSYSTPKHLTLDDMQGLCSIYPGCGPLPPPPTPTPTPTPTATPTPTRTPPAILPRSRQPQLAKD